MLTVVVKATAFPHRSRIDICDVPWSSRSQPARARGRLGSNDVVEDVDVEEREIESRDAAVMLKAPPYKSSGSTPSSRVAARREAMKEEERSALRGAVVLKKSGSPSDKRI